MTNHTETIKQLYVAFSKGDIPTVLGSLDAAAEWTEAEGFPYGGTYTGPDEVLQNVFMKLGTEWEGFAAVPAEFIAERDTVVVLGEYRGTYKATGKSFAAPMVHVWKLSGDKVVKFHQHTDTVVVQQALS